MTNPKAETPVLITPKMIKALFDPTCYRMSDEIIAALNAIATGQAVVQPAPKDSAEVAHGGGARNFRGLVSWAAWRL